MFRVSSILQVKWSKRINRPEKQIGYLNCNFVVNDGAGAPLQTTNRKSRTVEAVDSRPPDSLSGDAVTELSVVLIR